jgi:septal ring factor EnvC (AmiA/AmiB activator)
MSTEEEAKARAAARNARVAAQLATLKQEESELQEQLVELHDEARELRDTISNTSGQTQKDAKTRRATNKKEIADLKVELTDIQETISLLTPRGTSPSGAPVHVTTRPTSKDSLPTDGMMYVPGETDMDSFFKHNEAKMLAHGTDKAYYILQMPW